MYTSIQYTKEDERREREQLSDNEKQALFDDVHGRQQGHANNNNNRSSTFSRHSNEITVEHFLAFDEAMDQVQPFKMTENFWRAWVDHEELVNNESDVRWFILIENYNMPRAAVRLCEYWNARIGILGETNAFKPLSLRDNPGLRDLVTFFVRCPTNMIMRLPNDDFGRKVWYCDKSRKPRHNNVDDYDYMTDLKLYLYMDHHICKQPDYDPRDKLIWVAVSASISSLMDNYPMKYYKLMSKMIQNFPSMKQVAAYHMIGTSWFLHSVASMIKYGMSKDQRLRTNEYLLVGNKHQSLLRQLSGCGLQSKNLPTFIGGTYDDNNGVPRVPVWSAWVEEAEQVLQEEKRKRRKICERDRRER